MVDFNKALTNKKKAELLLLQFESIDLADAIIGFSKESVIVDMLMECEKEAKISLLGDVLFNMENHGIDAYEIIVQMRNDLGYKGEEIVK